MIRATTRDGRELYGMDAELYMKKEGKRDAEWESKVEGWICEVLGKSSLEPQGDLYLSLRDGQTLCEVMAAVVPGSIAKYNRKKEGKVMHPLEESDNIQLYLKACWGIKGFPSSDFFVPSDLQKGRSMSQVVQNITSLARTAVLELDYQGPNLGGWKKDTSAKAKRWESVETAPKFVHTDQVHSSKAEAIANRMALELADLTVEYNKLNAARLNRAEEVRGLQETHSQERAKLRLQRQQLEAQLSDLMAEDGGNEAPDTAELEAQAEEERAAVEVEKLTLRLADFEQEMDESRGKLESLVCQRGELEREARALKRRNKEMELTRERKVVVVQRTTPNEGTECDILAEMDAASMQAVEDLEESEIQYLRGRVTALLMNENVEMSDVAHLAQLFEREAARRELALAMRVTLKQKKQAVLSDSSFEVVLFLINNALIHLNLRMPSDLISAAAIAKSSYKIQRESSAEFLYTFIRRQDVWTSLTFWENSYIHQASKQYMKLKAAGVEEPSLSESRVVMTTSFVYNMIGWGVKHPNATKTFVERVSPEAVDQVLERLNLLVTDEDKTAQLEEEEDSFARRARERRERREAQAKKREKLISMARGENK